MKERVEKLVGECYVFEDGDKIEVIQVKSRSPEEYDTLVTCHVTQGPGISRKLVMNVKEFVDTYGHLFGITEE